jgi:hypothetical protein
MHVIGTRVMVSLAIRRRPPCVHATLAQLVHDMTHRQVFVDVLPGIHVSAGIQRLAALGNHLSGEWDVRRHDQVARLDVLGDGVICDVKPGWHLEHLNMGRRGIRSG